MCGPEQDLGETSEVCRAHSLGKRPVPALVGVLVAITPTPPGSLGMKNEQEPPSLATTSQHPTPPSPTSLGRPAGQEGVNWRPFQSKQGSELQPAPNSKHVGSQAPPPALPSPRAAFVSPAPSPGTPAPQVLGTPPPHSPLPSPHFCHLQPVPAESGGTRATS